MTYFRLSLGASWIAAVSTRMNSDEARYAHQYFHTESIAQRVYPDQRGISYREPQKCIRHQLHI